MRTTIASFALTCTALSAAPLAAQNATFQLAGTACTTLDGTPHMHSNGLPRIGTTFDVAYTGPNENGPSNFNIRPHLVVGFSSLGGALIPQFLFNQPPNCELHAAHDAVIGMPDNSTELWTTTYRFYIPFDPTLVGGVFHVQWVAVNYLCGIVAPCAPMWVATSEDGVATMGF